MQIETALTNVSNVEQMKKIESLTRDAVRNKSYHMRHLLTSLVHTLSKNDQKAVNDLHRYFDYQMRSKVTKANTETGVQEFVSWAVKVHHPALNLAGLLFKLGQLDQSLLSVMESIKISQNKNDHEGILQCLVWLQQIARAMGNKEQERRILEHILSSAYQQANTYIFIIGCLNYLALPLANLDSKSVPSAQHLSSKVREVIKALKIPA